MAIAPRAISLRHELARKTLHILTVIAPLAYAGGLPRRILVVLLAVSSALAVTVELARARHERTRALFHHVMGPLLRPHERDRWAGATWLLLAFLGVVLLTPRPIAIAAMWAVSAGDAAAALVGRSLARRRAAGRSGKTAAGSVACLVVTGLGALLIARLSPVESVIAAAAATAAERPQGGMDDNLRIVAAVAVALLAWRVAFS